MERWNVERGTWNVESSCEYAADQRRATTQKQREPEMPTNQRNGARSKSRDPEDSNQRNGACPRGGRDPDAELGCSDLQQNGVCARGSHDPEAVSEHSVPPQNDHVVTCVPGTDAARSSVVREGQNVDPEGAGEGSGGGGDPEGEVVVVSGQGVVAVDREEAVAVSGGSEEVGGGCSWADVVRGRTRGATPPAAAGRSVRPCSPRVGWGPVAPLTIRRHTDGRQVAFICESERWEWCCNNCNRNYHSFSSLTQHLRRVHQVSAFIMDCQTCRELFKNRRAYNSHLRGCSTVASSGTRLHRCGGCGAQYLLQESLEIHEGCCSQQGTTTSVSFRIWARGGKTAICNLVGGHGSLNITLTIHKA